MWGHCGGGSSVWNTAGATFSDKNAKKEFPQLTDEIIREALTSGKIQGRHGSMMGNSYIKLIRSEVSELVKEKFGNDYFQIEEQKKRLTAVRSELRKIPTEIKKLQDTQDELLKEEAELLEKHGVNAPAGRGRGAKTRGAAKNKTTAAKRKTPCDDDDYTPTAAAGRGRGGAAARGGRKAMKAINLSESENDVDED